MIYRLAADSLVLLHLCFILFVVVGGFLSWRWRRLIWVHVPAAVWGALIEFAGWVCPLTPLENQLRRLAGGEGYGGGFIEHYLMPVMYPPGLSSRAQILLGSFVILVNAIAYSVYFVQHRRRHNKNDNSPTLR